MRCWLRSPCGWQMRGNFMWARTANSGPNKLWIRLWCVWFHKNYRIILLKNPLQNTQVSITFLWRRPSVRWASTLLLFKENPRNAWDPAISRFCPSPSNTPASLWQTSWQTFQSKFRRRAPPLAGRWNQWAPQEESSLILTVVSFPKHAKTWVQAGCECWIRPVHGLLTQGKSCA